MIWLNFDRRDGHYGRYYGRYLVAERIYRRPMWRWTPFVRLRLRRKGEEEGPF